MKSLAAAACALALLLGGGPVRADWKGRTDELKSKTVLQEGLVGVWILTRSENAPAGSTVEFTRDGKMIVTVKDGGSTVSIKGTYGRGAKSITSRLNVGEAQPHEETVRIKKLTSKELVVEDAHGKVDEFKRK